AVGADDPVAYEELAASQDELARVDEVACTQRDRAERQERASRGRQVGRCGSERSENGHRTEDIQRSLVGVGGVHAGETVKVGLGSAELGGDVPRVAVLRDAQPEQE